MLWTGVIPMSVKNSLPQSVAMFRIVRLEQQRTSRTAHPHMPIYVVAGICLAGAGISIVFKTRSHGIDQEYQASFDLKKPLAHEILCP